MLNERTTSLPPLALLAGGLGTRIRSVAGDVPKSMIDLHGEPFIAHQLRSLRQQGITRVVICTGFGGEVIRDYVGSGDAFDLSVDYSFDGDKLLGTGGAIRKALPLLGGPFFVQYGDSYLSCDYRAVQETFAASGSAGLMTVFRNEGRWDTSNVEYAGGRILTYDKRNRTPRMAYIDYGLGVFAPRAFDGFPGDEPFDLAAVYQRLLARGDLAAYEVTERFYEIGSPQGLEETRALLARRASLRGAAKQ